LSPPYLYRKSYLLPAQHEQAKPTPGCWKLLIEVTFRKGTILVVSETGFHDYRVNHAADRLNQSGRKSGGTYRGKMGSDNRKTGSGSW
jgi:hypothetical protein